MNILERLIAEKRATGLADAPPVPPLPPTFRPSEVVQVPHFGGHHRESALAHILQLTGLTVDQLRQEGEHLVQAGEAVEVKDGPELRRIRDLPRRSLDSGEALVAEMSDAFRTPWGTMKLRPIQALALHDIHMFGGLLGPMRVGSGKTLTTYLAPEVMPRGPARRPLLVVPAKLKKKTLREFRVLSKHWMGPNPDAYRIETYELLGRPQAGRQLDRKGNVVKASLLERYKPDLIVLDEAHKAKNKQAAVTRNLRDYIRDNPNTVVIVLSGTIIKRSIKDFAHLAEWALPRMCPVPTHFAELEAWAGALDEKVSAFRRTRPGALIDALCSPEEKARAAYGGEEELSAVRQAFRRRLTDTPGVVATQDGPLADCSLSIEIWSPPKKDPVVDQHFHKLRMTGETPTGMPCADGIETKRHALEMGLGLEYRWDPAPPDEWLEVRKAWGKFSREVIKWNRRSIHSEKAVKNAVDLGLYPDGGLLERWRKLEPTFKPNTISVWFSSEALDAAALWIAQNPRGLVWCDNVAFSKALAAATGLSYYGREQKDINGRHVLDAPTSEGFIASIKSLSEGQNLQAWSTNLVMGPPSSGLTWEQMMGRTHRDGQEAEEVSFFVYIACREHAVDFWQAHTDGLAEQDMTGQAQKIRYADVEVPELEELADPDGVGRW